MRSTWYELLEQQADIDRSVHCVLGWAGIFLNTVGDIRLLLKVLSAAARFQTAPADEELKEAVTSMEVAPNSEQNSDPEPRVKKIGRAC